MRIKQTVNVRIAEDTAMQHIIFGKDDNLSVSTLDGYTQQSSGTINIAADSNENIPIGDIDTIAGLFVSVDQDCSIVLNSGVEIINIVKPVGGNAVFFMNGVVSNLNIATTEALTGLFCIWG